MIERFVDEWRAIPWTPRARRIGRFLEGAAILTLLLFGPAIVEAIVNLLVP